MRKVAVEELFLMNGSAVKLLSYIKEQLKKQNVTAIRLDYNKTAEALNLSRHAVSYNVRKLCEKERYIRIRNDKIELTVELPENFKVG